MGQYRVAVFIVFPLSPRISDRGDNKVSPFSGYQDFGSFGMITGLRTRSGFRNANR